MNGILNIDKPAGMTSHDVVSRIRRAAATKRVGHAGTLDPEATGVLLICMGQSTRLAEYLASEGKSYRAEMALGVSTDTQDAGGRVLSEMDASAVRKEDLLAELPRFVGCVMQVPPMVSALHHEGRRLYDLARQGIEVDRPPREICIERIDLLKFEAGVRPVALLDVSCGKGTYVRTLCHDIGAALGVGGHMRSLRRTRVGCFHVETAAPLEGLDAQGIADRLVSASAAMSAYPEHICRDPGDRDSVRHGRALATDLAESGVSRIADESGRLIALGRVENGRIYPFKVFAD